MPQRKAGVVEKKPVYGVPDRMWRLEDVMNCMGLEREAAVDLLQEAGADMLKEGRVLYFQYNRIYFIHPVIFALWLEKKLEENANGQKEERYKASTP